MVKPVSLLASGRRPSYRVKVFLNVRLASAVLGFANSLAISSGDLAAIASKCSSEKTNITISFVVLRTS